MVQGYGHVVMWRAFAHHVDILMFTANIIIEKRIQEPMMGIRLQMDNVLNPKNN